MIVKVFTTSGFLPFQLWQHGNWVHFLSLEMINIFYRGRNWSLEVHLGRMIHTYSRPCHSHLLVLIMQVNHAGDRYKSHYPNHLLMDCLGTKTFIWKPCREASKRKLDCTYPSVVPTVWQHGSWMPYLRLEVDPVPQSWRVITSPEALWVEWPLHIPDLAIATCWPWWCR